MPFPSFQADIILNRSDTTPVAPQAVSLSSSRDVGCEHLPKKKSQKPSEQVLQIFPQKLQYMNHQKTELASDKERAIWHMQNRAC